MTESRLQELLDRHPDLLPIDEIGPWGPQVSLGREVPLPVRVSYRQPVHVSDRRGDCRRDQVVAEPPGPPRGARAALGSPGRQPSVNPV
jgi:hypothetical protein